MSKDYTLKELQSGIDSDRIEWSDSSNLPEHRGNRSGLPMHFEFPALCRMADLLKCVYCDRERMFAAFPRGFVVKMAGTRYSTLEIVPKQ